MRARTDFKILLNDCERVNNISAIFVFVVRGELVKMLFLDSFTQCVYNYEALRSTFTRYL